MTPDWTDSVEGTTAYRDVITGRTSLHRWGTAAHIAQLVAEMESTFGGNSLNNLREIEHRALTQGDRRPERRHRLGKILVKLQKIGVELGRTGGAIPSFDGRGNTMLTEMARYCKVLHAWKDHPWFSDFQNNLISADQWAHDIGLLSVVPYLQRNDLAVRFVKTGEDPLPDLAIIAPNGTEAPVEVKAPWALHRPGRSQCVTVAGGRRATAKAWGKARKQLTRDSHGMLIILSQGLCSRCTSNVVDGITLELNAGLGDRRNHMPGIALFREHEVHSIERVPDAIMPMGWHAKHHHWTLSEFHFVNNRAYRGPVIIPEQASDKVRNLMGPRGVGGLR